MARSARQLATVSQHLDELRRRLSWTAGVFVLGGAATYYWRNPVVHFLQQPLHSQLFYTSPTGNFEFMMQICFLGGFIVALPVLLYHILRFVEPALPKKFSRAAIAGLILTSCGLAVGGCAFGFLISMPAALNFFGHVGANNVSAMITADRYFSFVVSYLATFAAVFQLPMALLLIDNFTPLDPPMLGRSRKWVILGSFAIALVLPSTPDPLSQVVLALPIITLYELSIWAVRLRHRRLRRRQNRNDRQVTAPAPAVVPEPRYAQPRPAQPSRRHSPQLAPVLDLSKAAQPLAKPQSPAANILDLRSRPSL